MRYHRQRPRVLPDCVAPIGPERFSGMQDPSLRMPPLDPRWAEIEGTEEHLGSFVINTANLPDLREHPDPRAEQVLQALKRLGVVDKPNGLPTTS